MVFLGLVVCGLVLLAGYIMNVGSLKALAAYFGWFLCAYSGLAYLAASVHFSMKGGGRFWNSIYPLNFGLALLALSLFGIHDQRTIVIMVVAALVAMGLAIVLSRSHVLGRRYTPVAPFGVLGIAMIEPIFPAWKYLSAFVGVFLLATACIELRLNMGSGEPLGGS